MKNYTYATLALFVFIFPCAAFGATFHVPNDQPTIQACIDEAENGDLVLVAPGTYMEIIDFLGKSITVQGEEGEDVTVIDGYRAGSVVSFASGEDEEAIIDGFTLTNGVGNYMLVSPEYYSYCGGGVFCDASSPTITHCNISNNSAFAAGGICCWNDSVPTIENCTIEYNTASQGEGGGIGSWGKPAIIRNCMIIGNSSMGSSFAGGGISINAGEDENDVEIIGCTIQDNIAFQGGGLSINVIDLTSRFVATVEALQLDSFLSRIFSAFSDWLDSLDKELE